MMGGLYGVPIVTGVPFVLYYNQDILDSIGEKAPETWEDFARICEKATKDTDGDGKIDQYGYAVGLNSGSMSNLYVLNSYMYSLLWQAGGDIYTDDLKEVAFNGKAGVEALEFSRVYSHICQKMQCHFLVKMHSLQYLQKAKPLLV